MTYKRVLLKISGEALKGSSDFGLNPSVIKEIAKEIADAKALGAEIGIVCGGGNIWRGKTASEMGMERSQADYMGMLATVMNGLAIQESLEALGFETRVLSAITINEVCEPYIRRRAIRHLEKGRICIFVGGVGSPYFSTDTACVLRALEINADCLMVAKNNADGVFDKDPNKFKNAVMYHDIKFSDMLAKNLAVMDQTAVALSMENDLPIVVFNMNKKGNIKKAVSGEDIGTRVSN